MEEEGERLDKIYIHSALHVFPAGAGNRVSCSGNPSYGRRNSCRHVGLHSGNCSRAAGTILLIYSVLTLDKPVKL